VRERLPRGASVAGWNHYLFFPMLAVDPNSDDVPASSFRMRCARQRSEALTRCPSDQTEILVSNGIVDAYRAASRAAIISRTTRSDRRFHRLPARCVRSTHGRSWSWLQSSFQFRREQFIPTMNGNKLVNDKNDPNRKARSDKVDDEITYSCIAIARQSLGWRSCET
jgi:hypothetical protein